jgi:hypothetical protein
MKALRFTPLVLAAIILGCLGLASCKKNFQRLMAVTTTSIDPNTYLAKGEIIDVGNSSPQFGFCYSTNSNPNLSNSTVLNLGTTSSPKSFQTNVSAGAGTYYICSYAKSSEGTVYGGVLKFVVTSGVVEYAFDSGADDYGWRINPDYDSYMGNLFPVTTSGTIQSVRVYFSPATDAGTEYVSIVFFDVSRSQIGSTSVFVPTASSWLTQSGLSIPYSGNFYAMVYWNYLLNPTNYLAMDQSGPNVAMDLGYYMSQNSWSKLSTNPSGNQKPGIFLIRVTVLLSTNKGTVITELGPAPGPVNPGNALSPPASSIPGNAAKRASSPLQAKPVSTK